MDGIEPPIAMLMKRAERRSCMVRVMSISFLCFIFYYFVSFYLLQSDNFLNLYDPQLEFFNLRTNDF